MTTYYHVIGLALTSFLSRFSLCGAQDVCLTCSPDDITSFSPTVGPAGVHLHHLPLAHDRLHAVCLLEGARDETEDVRGDCQPVPAR